MSNLKQTAVEKIHLMLVRLPLLLLLFVLPALLPAQTHPPTCAQNEYGRQLYRQHPEFKKTHDILEAALYKQRGQGLLNPPASFIQDNNTVVLPVVIHIIHNNGAENISDAQVKQGIKWLNDAYAASGYYNTNKSTNTHIQFCLAERDPDGKATNGITRNVSKYTNMGGDSYSADDLHVKDINRWNPYNYINVWVVADIPTDVVGYSTLPEAHGSQYEGIVMEAQYFGSTEFNNVVLIHEIGHYLGMYHTFEGGCTNNNCQVDGDMVCDTPPDQSTAYTGCESSMNSCTTDVLSGFNTDQPDLTQDFMDYGNFNCMKAFTPGQSERMNWFVQNALYSLLHTKSCMAPCLSPARAVFSISASTVQVNTTINFTNHSVNAGNYIWFVDGVKAATSKDFSKAFAVQGRHIIKLQANSGDILCDSAVTTDTVTVTCPVKAAFSYPAGVIKMGETVSFTNTSQNAASYTWKVDKVTRGNSAQFSSTFPQPGIYNVMLVAYGVCTDSVTQPVSVYDSLGHIPQDICKPITFQKNYLNNSAVVWDFRTTRDSGYIMSGLYAVPFTDGNGGGLVTKLSKAGGVEWSRYIQPFGNLWVEKVKENADGSFIACGIKWDVTTSVQKSWALVLKLDAKGNVLWMRNFAIAGSDREVAMDITETADGGYAFCGGFKDDSYTHTDWLVAKLDNRGNIAWSKRFDNGFYERAYGIIANGANILVAGIRTLPTGPRSEIVITEMAATSGNVIRSQSYGVASRSVETPSIFKIPGGYLIGAHSVQDGFYYADMDQVALQVDENLQPVRVAKLNVDVFAGINSGIAPTPDGGFVTARNSFNWSISHDPTWMAIAKISPDWQLEWIKKYPSFNSNDHDDFAPNTVGVTPDGGYAVGETTYSPDEQYYEHLRVIKTDRFGNTPGCKADTFSAVLEVPALTSASFTWDSVINIVFNSPANPVVTPVVNNQAALTVVQRCATSDCDSIKLIGSSSICSLVNPVTYKAGRNAACVSSVLWQVDTMMASIAGYTDSTIQLRFKKQGKVQLLASIFTACKVLQDSLVITVNNSPSVLNLGPDIALCTNSTVRLSAGYGFKTYQWNTGTTDSTYTAYLPGKYYVTVTDYCGSTFSDTVLLTTAPAIKLNLSANALRCDKDSVALSTTAGFISYTWSPHYNISSTSAANVTVWPAVDTTYTVVAVINDHCTVTDSTRVHILQSAPISIGNDTSFCAGGVALLQAPPGFKGYLWQDGSTGNTFNAMKKGLYYLYALNANGCYSKDTMQVTDVYTLPVVNLGNDGPLCLNNTTLHAGPGQAAYLWQDGSTDSMFTVTITGSYWVQVTGNHSCINSDTIVITGFNAVPANFLAPAPLVCEHGSVQLASTGSWSNYLWIDGYTTPAIYVTKPGLYWLQVTSNDGCTGRDSVIVAFKTDCPKVIYFPNAFTPNGDGSNDYFKPFTGAPLEKYNLQIYNRWGQKIFESNDALNGWDGSYRGAKILTGTLVYVCRYKFYGEAEGVVKGSVVVMR